jgi:hypothetical protein
MIVKKVWDDRGAAPITRALRGWYLFAHLGSPAGWPKGATNVGAGCDITP